MSALQVSTSNNVKIYTVASASRSAIPEWLAASRKKALRHDPHWQRRVELIQDFEFPEASYRLKATPDGNYLIATGVYKPQIRVYELAQMSMKFERHTDCENVQFEILSDDWRKMVLLQADRSVEFHTANGMHYRTRIPKFGRDMKYHAPSCDLLLGAAGPEVYRLNLEQGRFLNSIHTDSPGINCCSINPANQMWAFGGEDGCVEFWDPRERRRLARTNPASILLSKYGGDAFDRFPEITTMEFMNDGLTYAVGTSTGQVLLHDLRSTQPLLIKDHQYEYPIKRISFHASSDNVISCDTKAVKIWNKNSGALYAAVEPESDDVNDMLAFPDSGLVMTANEGTRMNIFYVPSLGPAPKWCSFLDSLTEELEESSKQQVYDDYRFVTRRELTSLGLDHLIGTNVLKAYMHGFFIDLRLYEKAKIISNPFAYDEYRERLVREKLEKEQQSRISAVNKLPKVNRALAAKLLSKPAKIKAAEAEDKDEKTTSAQNPLGDTRFADMFADPDFQLDEQDPEYVKLHTRPKTATSVHDQFQSAESEQSEPDGHGSDEESFNEMSKSDDSDAEDELLPKHARFKKSRDSGKRDAKSNATSRSQPRLYEHKDNQSWDQVLRTMQSKDGGAQKSRQRSFEDRLRKSKASGEGGKDHAFTHRASSGAMSMTWTPSSGKGRKANKTEPAEKRFRRRH